METLFNYIRYKIQTNAHINVYVFLLSLLPLPNTLLIAAESSSFKRDASSEKLEQNTQIPEMLPFKKTTLLDQQQYFNTVFKNARLYTLMQIEEDSIQSGIVTLPEQFSKPIETTKEEFFELKKEALPKERQDLIDPFGFLRIRKFSEIEKEFTQSEIKELEQIIGILPFEKEKITDCFSGWNNYEEYAEYRKLREQEEDSTNRTTFSKDILNSEHYEQYDNYKIALFKKLGHELQSKKATKEILNWRDFIEEQRKTEQLSAPLIEAQEIRLTPRQCANYKLPNGKELWFILDCHDSEEIYNFMKMIVLKDQDFDYGIIEDVLFTTAIESNSPYINFSKVTKEELELPSNKNSAIAVTQYLLEQKGKNTLVGDFKTSIRHADFFKKIKIDDYIIYNLVHCYGSITNKEQEDALHIKTIMALFPSTNLDFLKQAIEAKNEDEYEAIIQKRFKNLDPNFDTNDIEIYIRDLQLATTILQTMQKPDAKKVCVMYGANHWFTLKFFLEFHFGKPNVMSFQDYFINREKISKN